jgi:hypothetical protein
MESAVMSSREAKFCLDRNKVRWVLLEGVINRKTQEDDPAGGQNLPVSQIQRIEKTVVEIKRRSPVAMPAVYAGLILAALFGWIAAMSLWVGLPGVVLGAVVLLWGLMRLGGTTEKLDAFQIVAPGIRTEEWRVLGSHHEVLGFIHGVEAEMGARGASRN